MAAMQRASGPAGGLVMYPELLVKNTFLQFHIPPWPIESSLTRCNTSPAHIGLIGLFPSCGSSSSNAGASATAPAAPAAQPTAEVTASTAPAVPVPAAEEFGFGAFPPDKPPPRQVAWGPPSRNGVAPQCTGTPQGGAMQGTQKVQAPAQISPPFWKAELPEPAKTVLEADARPEEPAREDGNSCPDSSNPEPKAGGGEGGAAGSGAAESECDWVAVTSRKSSRGVRGGASVVAPAALAVSADSSGTGHATGGSSAASAQRCAKEATQQKGPLLHKTIDIGLEDDTRFRIVKRLIGPGGENMRSITRHCPGTSVDLRGTGVNCFSSHQPETGPLMLHVRGKDPVQVARAVELASELRKGVLRQYQLFLAGELDEETPHRGSDRQSPVANTSDAASPVEDEAKSLYCAPPSEGESTSANNSTLATEEDDEPETGADEGGDESDGRVTGLLGALQVSSNAGAGARTPAAASGDIAAAAAMAAATSKAPSRAVAGGSSSSTSGHRGKATPERSFGAVAGAAATVANRESRGRANDSKPLLHKPLEVGLEDDTKFRVVKRLIGTNGENMRNISGLCPGTSIELRGRGVIWCNQTEGGPLTLHVKGRDQEQFAKAVELATELLRDVWAQHKQFYGAKGSSTRT